MVQRVDVSHRSMFSFVHKNNAKSTVFGQEEFVLASFLKTRLSILKIPLGLKSLNLSAQDLQAGRIIHIPEVGRLHHRWWLEAPKTSILAKHTSTLQSP